MEGVPILHWEGSCAGGSGGSLALASLMMAASSGACTAQPLADSRWAQSTSSSALLARAIEGQIGLSCVSRLV